MNTILNITEEGRGGGALGRIVIVARALSGFINSIVVFPKGSAKLKNHLISNEIPHIEIPLCHLTRQPSGLFLYLLNFKRDLNSLKKIIRETNASLVHCNGSWQVKGVLAAHAEGLPAIWHLNDMYQPRPVLFSFQRISKKAYGFVFASRRTKLYYSTIAPYILQKPHVIIPAPVNTEIYFPGSSDVLSQYPGIKVLTIGYINPNKDLESYILSAAMLREQSDREYHFFVVGKVLDSQEGYYQKLLRLKESLQLTNIHFLGHRNDISELLRSCDLYVCSSRVESSPMALWEAMASGCLVLSTDVGDVQDIFSSHNCGHFIPREDPKALCEKIIEITGDREDEDVLRNNARSAAVELFSIPVIENKYRAFYQKCLSNA